MAIASSCSGNGSRAQLGPGVAAVLEGFRFLGLEQDAEAVRVARLRIHHRRPNPDEVAAVEPARARQGRLF